FMSEQQVEGFVIAGGSHAVGGIDGLGRLRGLRGGAVLLFLLAVANVLIDEIDQALLVDPQHLGGLPDIVFLPGKTFQLVDTRDGLGDLGHDGGFFVAVVTGVLEGYFQLEEDDVLFIGCDEFAEFGGAHEPYVTVGVCFIWDQHQADVETFLQRHIETPKGGFDARAVAIVDDGEVFGIFLYKPELVDGERGAATGHYVLDPCLVKREHVGVAFYQQTFVLPVDGLTRLVGAIQDLAFDIDLVLGCVDVFGGAVVGLEDAGAEADDLAGVVMDGEDHAAAVVVGESFVTQDDETGLLEIFRVVLRGKGGTGKAVAGFGVVAELELADGVFVEAAFFEIAQTDVLSFVRVEQDIAKEFLCKAVDDKKAIGYLLLLP